MQPLSDDVESGGRVSPRLSRAGPGSVRCLVFRLRLCYPMLDRQRAIMRRHFPVVLSRNRVDSPFCPLFEHSGTLNQILGTGHGTLCAETLPLYVGEPLCCARPTAFKSPC